MKPGISQNGADATVGNLAEEIAESLKLGDHLRHDRQFLRGWASFLTIAIIALSRPRTIIRPKSEVSFVISNPVAHGSRFGSAVLRGLVNWSVSIVGDRRLAQGPIAHTMVHFPSLTARSLSGLVTCKMIARGFQLRRTVRLATADYPSLSRIYLECLFLLQAIRYGLAKEYVLATSDDHLWLSDFDRHAYCRPLLWWARVAGRPTATFVHGSPNSNYIPPLAENILVWGDAQASWFQGAAPEVSAHIIGRPEFGVMIPAGQPRRLRIMHSLEILSNAEQRKLLEVCGASKDLGITVTLRLHPSAGPDQLDDGWKALLLDCDLEDNNGSLVESFESGDVVVGISSTAMVDAVASGLPAWSAADYARELPCDLEFLRGTSHFVDPRIHASSPNLPALYALSAATDLLRSSVVRATNEESTTLIRECVGSILRSARRRTH